MCVSPFIDFWNSDRWVPLCMCSVILGIIHTNVLHNLTSYSHLNPFFHYNFYVLEAVYHYYESRRRSFNDSRPLHKQKAKDVWSASKKCKLQ